MLIVASTTAAAEPFPADPAVPVVIVNAGHLPGNAEIEAVIANIDAPVTRGAKIRSRIGLANLQGAPSRREVVSDFEKAKDLFFSGDHETARKKLDSIDSSFKKWPAMLSSEPKLRVVLFETFLYLAVIARSPNPDLADSLLESAASRFPDLEPGAADFPPWLRDQFLDLREHTDWSRGTINFEGPPDCDLRVDGRSIRQPGDKLTDILLGHRTLLARCHGKLSPIVSVEIGDTPVSWRPIILSHSEIVDGKDDLVIDFQMEVDDGDMARDLIEIAQAGGWPRLVAVVGRPDSLEAWLVDPERQGLIRKSVTSGKNLDEVGSLGASLSAPDPERDHAGEEGSRRAWYRDGAAWTLVGTGLAVLGAGIAVARINGEPSSQEPAALALMMSGGVITGTGLVLFFIPRSSNPQGDHDIRSPMVGAAGSWSF
jgi:hypothetical protein